MSPTRLRRALGLGVSALAVAVVAALGGAAVGNTAAVTPSTSDTGVASCRTDTAGYCTVQHGLGSVPVSALVSPVFYPGTTPYLMAVAKNGMTAVSLRVRAVYNSGAAVANGAIEFSYVVHAGPAAPPPPPPPPPPVGGACENPTWTTTSNDNNGGAQDFGEYTIHNNMWNNHAGQGPTGTYTLGACSASSWYSLVTQQPSTLSPGAVRAYPNVHKDYDDVPLSQIKSATFAATAPHCQGCVYNVAFDAWLGSDFDNELMIWTENFRQTPAGSRLSDADQIASNGTSNLMSIGGKSYQVWKAGGATTPGGIFSYVADPVQVAGTMPLDLFWADLERRNWIDGESTTWQIDFGWEVVSTAGTQQRLDVTDFSITEN